MTRFISLSFKQYLLSDVNKNSKEATQLILSTLNFLRIEYIKAGMSTGTRFWDTPFWREIDLLQVANAAQQCSAYFTCLLNLELWWEATFSSVGFIFKKFTHFQSY